VRAQCENRTLRPVNVLTPTTLDEALRLKADHPSAKPIQGGTDLMVALNFDRERPAEVLNLNEVPELRGYARENGALRLCSGLTYAEIEHGELRDVLAALAETARETTAITGDAIPPLVVEGAEVECASVRGTRRIPVTEFVTGVKRNALEPDELITAVWVTPSNAPQTFMKVGPRNAMVIAVVSLAVSAGDELRASIGSAAPRPVLVSAPREESATFAERVAAAASPIDDVRGTERYRRHAIRVLTERALKRVLA
jgi:CO/xanthine dehydrogenase FAD-binding subunit